MSERVTRKDVESVFETYREVFETYGLVTPGSRLHLEIGSSTYGRAYQVYEIRDGQTGLSEPLVGRSFLGMTASEAYSMLSERIRTVGDIARALDLKRSV